MSRLDELRKAANYRLPRPIWQKEAGRSLLNAWPAIERVLAAVEGWAEHESCGRATELQAA